MGTLRGLAEGGSSWAWDSELPCPGCASAVGCACVHLQLYGHLAASEKRSIQIQLVELAEQSQVFRALRPRLIVIGRARHSQQFALLLNAEPWMSGMNPLPF